MKNCKIWCGVLTALTLSLPVVVFTAWRMGWYLPWSDVPSGVRNESDLREWYVNSNLKPLTLKFVDEDVELDSDEFIDVDASVAKQNFKEYLRGSKPEVICTWAFDDKTLDSSIKELYKKSQNAYIEMDDSGRFELVEEDYGRDFEADELKDKVLDALRKQEQSVDVTPIQNVPSITKSDLDTTYDKVEWVNDWKIVYKDGPVIDASFLKNFWTARYDLRVDEISYDEVMRELDEEFDTSHKFLVFQKTGGAKVSIPYNTYGKRVNWEEEEEFLSNAILTRHTEVNRVPETYGYDDFNDTYLEVSLSQQHVWHYVDGKLCCDSDCVTGRANVHDTPTGVFYVSERINGKNLVGEGYKTWVNKWMRLTNQGIGLHDAYWRGSFGKDVYKYNGSHGCINLPSSYAYTLFDEIRVGIPTVVY